MTTQLIVVEELADWQRLGLDSPVVHVDDYLTSSQYFNMRGVQVINLCRSYRYLSIGYYCSLLAEARRHRVIPSVRSQLDLSSKAMYSVEAEDLDELIQRSMKKHHRGAAPSDEFEMAVFFGRCRYEGLASLARQIFEFFPVPLLKVRFTRTTGWQVEEIRPMALNRLRKEEREFFVATLADYIKKPWRSPRSRTYARYDLAILHDPEDPLPPSDPKALQKFIKAGRALGMDVELITRKDYPRLAEYDALFIRDTTRINHYTYRFAKKAESEGMVVIDDPQSILRCTNKVYMAELLRANKIPAPKTVIVGKQDLAAAERAIGFPMVLKVPDGSFSQGVSKAENSEQMAQLAAKLFETSELILAQEFVYTAFDWRIGILNRKPFYVAQYFMPKRHWQIVKYDDKGKATQGTFKTYPVDQAPKEVLEMALKAANLIGDGLYGVDVKQNQRGVFVIEINDNPSLDAGVEDAYLKDDLYRTVMAEFLRRLELRHAEPGRGREGEGR